MHNYKNCLCFFNNIFVFVKISEKKNKYIYFYKIKVTSEQKDIIMCYTCMNKNKNINKKSRHDAIFYTGISFMIFSRQFSFNSKRELNVCM